MKLKISTPKAIKHLLDQPFVFATGLAALIHSTWSLGTLFAGEQPDPETQLIAFLGWFIPAVLMSFALDIGQIMTSVAIREKGLTIERGITFFVFAIATFYLQWIYMIHHVPALELTGGVRAEWRDSVIWLRDASIVIIPSLLPLSTLLYTFSDKAEHETQAETVEPTIEITQSDELIDLEGDNTKLIERPTEKTDDETIEISKDVPDFLAQPHPQTSNSQKNVSGAERQLSQDQSDVNIVPPNVDNQHIVNQNGSKVTNG